MDYRQNLNLTSGSWHYGTTCPIIARVSLDKGLLHQMTPSTCVSSPLRRRPVTHGVSVDVSIYLISPCDPLAARPLHIPPVVWQHLLKVVGVVRTPNEADERPLKTSEIRVVSRRLRGDCRYKRQTGDLSLATRGNNRVVQQVLQFHDKLEANSIEHQFREVVRGREEAAAEPQHDQRNYQPRQDDDHRKDRLDRPRDAHDDHVLVQMRTFDHHLRW